MVYKFREGHSAPIPAQVIGERLAELEADDRLNPASVVEDARPDDSPLHPAFEWDDEEAAGRYREDQARSLIRSVYVMPDEADEEDTPEPRIAFVSVGSPVPGGARYVDSAKAMTDVDMRMAVLGDAIRALNGLRARYGHLRELGEVFAALDSLEVVAK